MKILFIHILIMLCLVVNSQTKNNQPAKASEEKKYVLTMNTSEFKQKVYNYTVNKSWKYEGNTPCIIDFYADWCGPCRRVSPILETLAKEYNGKVVFYKINTDNEQVLSSTLGITSLPTIVFIPVKGNPQVLLGAYPKEQYDKIIKEFLLAEKKQQ